jgi:hypothetical protein
LLNIIIYSTVLTSNLIDRIFFHATASLHANEDTLLRVAHFAHNLPESPDYTVRPPFSFVLVKLFYKNAKKNMFWTHLVMNHFVTHSRTFKRVRFLAVRNLLLVRHQ